MKKTHIPHWAIALIATLLFSMSSCTKPIPGTDQMPSITGGFQVAGIAVYWGNNTNLVGYWYPASAYSGYIGNGGQTITTVCYVSDKPSNPEFVIVRDGNNTPIATVRCDGGTGITTNLVFNSLTAWMNSNPGKSATVVTTWTVPFTHGGDWHGVITKVFN